jgi:hypothetical protein
MLRVIGLLVLLTAACTAELAPDENGSAPATSQLGGPHLGMTMTPAIKACREGCWATTPFGACAPQHRRRCRRSARMPAVVVRVRPDAPPMHGRLLG